MEVDVIMREDSKLVLEGVVELDKRGKCSLNIPKRWAEKHVGKRVRITIEVIE